MTPENKSNLAVSAVVIASSLVLMLLIYGVYARFRDSVVDQTRSQLVATATEAARDVDAFLAQHIDVLQTVLSNPLVLRELSSADGDKPILALLSGTLRPGRPVAAIDLYDSELVLRKRLSRFGDAGNDLPDPQSLRAALEQRRAVTAPALVWRDGTAHVEVALPILAQPDASALGVARVLIRVDAAISQHVAEARANGEGYSWALARDGTTIWHPVESKIGKPMLTQLEELAPSADADALRAILLDMMAGNTGSGVYQFSNWRLDPGSNVMKIVGYAPVSSLQGGLSVAMAVEYAAIAGPIHRYARRVALLGVAVVAVIGIGAALFLRGSRQSRRRQSELLEQLQHVLSVSPAAVYHLKRGASGELEPSFFSASMHGIFGYQPEDWRDGPQWWQQRIHPEDGPSIREAWRILAGTGQVEHRFRFRHSEGHYLWVRDVARLLRDADGKIEELVGSWQDITATHETEERLRLAERLFENAVEGAVVSDLDWRILRVNDALLRMLGCTAEDLIGQICPTMRPGQQPPDYLPAMLQAMRETGSWSGEVTARRGNGEIFPVRMSLSSVHDDNGRITHYTGLISDLSTQRQLEQTVQRLSHYDPVTGLPNRALLMEHLEQELGVASRRKERAAVLFIDLDRFKQVNETLGRAVGDSILKQIAIRLQYGLPTGAILTQPGGDQFVVILPALADIEHAGAAAAEVARLIGEPLKLDDIKLEITASIGISVYPDDAVSAPDLLHNAEAAMHHVKGDANPYHFFTNDLNERAIRRLKLTRALRDSVARNELKLAYQPQLDLVRGRVIGVEALLRWENPELGLISPAEFVPLAEESGLIVSMGEWVLREACRQAAGWQVHGPVRVGVNLSLRQFQAGTLKQTVNRVLDETGLEPSLLELEITESLAMADPAGTTATLDSLRELGIRLALDDFGTGYSSLAYLQRLPLDTLKIDRAFIEHLETKQDDRVLTFTIISMAHALGLTVIAEGVETAGQLEILRENRCDEIQGYFISRPLYASDFESWFQGQRERMAKLAGDGLTDLA